ISWIIEPQMDYSMELGKGKLNFTAGATLQERNFDQIVQIGRGYPTNEFLESFNAANDVSINSEKTTQYRYSALYGRLNYNYDGKYILNISGRRDGSSRFGPNK